MKTNNHDASKRFAEVLNIGLVYLSLIEKKKQTKSIAVRFVVHKQLCIKFFLLSIREDLTSGIEMAIQYFWYVSHAGWTFEYSNKLELRVSTIYAI